MDATEITEVKGQCSGQVEYDCGEEQVWVPIDLEDLKTDENGFYVDISAGECPKCSEGHRVRLPR